MNEGKIKGLIREISSIITYTRSLEKSFSSEVYSTHPTFRKSSRNLLHYLALRNFDIRSLQQTLAEFGLSSLGRAEAHVLSSLNTVLNQLKLILNNSGKTNQAQTVEIAESTKFLDRNTKKLLGAIDKKRSVRIMVTLSSETANNYDLVKNLMLSGMDCARINCAHDDETIWIKMIENIHRARRETGLACKILMDLAGLKLRTGRLKEGLKILKIKARKDFGGDFIRPAKIWLSPREIKAPAESDVHIPVKAEWIRQIKAGDKIQFTDVRGKKRKLKIVSCLQEGCFAEVRKKSFIEPGTILTLKNNETNIDAARVEDFPAREAPVILKKNDLLIIHASDVPGENAMFDGAGKIIRPAHVPCSFSEIFNDIKIDDPILFDDGKIEGKIIAVSSEEILVRITKAKADGSKLRSDKGINLPQSKIHMSGLTKKDLKDLPFVAKHAHVVNLSFVNEPADIFRLQEELKKLSASHIGIMLKIETQKGFKNLPLLLLALMKSYPAGVMIARGDLAVECGWDRLAEIQEEVLWLCEAAHLPVVWATQVLETLAKKGVPSRAEITDAAMSQRAECVMLNKGPYLLDAIKMLSEILERMESHQHKKSPVLRKLKICDVSISGINLLFFRFIEGIFFLILNFLFLEDFT